MSHSDPTIAEIIRSEAARLEPYIIDMRRHFHRHPELGGAELLTSQRLCDELDHMGVEYRRVSGPRPQETAGDRSDFIGTGIIATIRGTAPNSYDAHGNPRHRVALRTDMDALHVTERTGVDYVSENPGVMHACGHDCHMAMMLGAVHILNSIKDRLHGEVRIIFQPAEEISIGARDMIAAGALDGVDAIFGQHVWSEVDAGYVSCEAGPRMAYTDWFRIDIEGVSAHGSMPHKGIDAIVVAAEIVDTLQTIVSRVTSPFEPVVVTVGEIHGGTARNVMAGSAYLTGTIRSWHAGVRELMIEHMRLIASNVGDANGATVTYTFEQGNPGVINEETCSKVACAAVEKVLGPDGLCTYEGTLAGEDFAEYLQRIPGVFAFIGVRNPSLGTIYPQHSCYYNVDESVLVNGSMVAAMWAHDMLA